MADTKQAPAAAAEKAEQKTRPAMPDEAEFKKKLNVAEKELKEAEDKLVCKHNLQLTNCCSSSSLPQHCNATNLRQYHESKHAV